MKQRGGYGLDNEQQTLVGDEPALELDNTEHLSRDVFSKAQSAIIDIDITATPAEMAQGLGTVNVWKLAPQLSREFKQNLATKNRNMASDDQLAGNLNRCIPLHLEVLQQQNTFPYFVGIKIPGMMDKTLYKSGSCVHRVPPATQTMMVKEAVFEPVNHVTQYMYANYRLCTLEDLKDAIRFVPGTKTAPPHAAIAVNSLAYKSLCDNLAEGHWQDQHGLFEMEDVFEPGRNHSVQVTEVIGKQLHEQLHPLVSEAAESFINLEDFNVEIVRADEHQAFNSPKGIHGEIKSDKFGSKLVSDKLQSKCTFHVKARLDYILF